MNLGRRWSLVFLLGTLSVGFVAASVAAPTTARDPEITWVVDTVFWVASVDGGGRNMLVGRDSDGSDDPAWTRDGVALARYVRYSDSTFIDVIWPGTKKAIEFRSVHDRSFSPTWSPDGRRIAVSEDCGGYGRNLAAGLMIVSVAKNSWTPVTKCLGLRIDDEPAWSPDGVSIAFSRTHVSRVSVAGRPGLFLIRPDGGGVQFLTPGRSPSWSPDGRRLAFAFGDGIFEIDADGSERKEIIGGLRHPLVDWSPDGGKLLYTSGRDLWVANSDGTQRTRLVHALYRISGIAWRPR